MIESLRERLRERTTPTVDVDPAGETRQEERSGGDDADHVRNTNRSLRLRSAAYGIARAGRGTDVRPLGHQDVDVVRQLRCDANMLAGPPALRRNRTSRALIRGPHCH